MQCRQPVGSDQCDDKTNAAETEYGPVKIRILISASNHQPGLPAEQYRKDEGQVTKHEEQYIREPGTAGPDQIRDLFVGASVAPAGIVRIKAGERQN